MTSLPSSSSSNERSASGQQKSAGRKAANPATPANAPVALANLPGRGEVDSQNQPPPVASPRKMTDEPLSQPVSPAARTEDPLPITVTKRTPTAGEEQTIRAAGVEFSFVYVPAGPFPMGSNEYDDEKPLHTMPVEAFWLGKTPITNAHFRPFVDARGYTQQAFWTKSGWQWRTGKKITQPVYWTDEKWNAPQQPVVGISWYEAMAYAAWLAQTTKQPIRLPTEAEWEKGARGTDGRKYPWGNDAPDKSRCNFDGNEGKTMLVGKHLAGASPYGALDMAGNVWEWTATKWVGNYENYADVVDKDGDATRVLRGGAWYVNSDFVRSANRFRDDPFSRNYVVGFRLVLFAPGG